MTISIAVREARAMDVIVTDDTLTLELVDGRTISVPIGWFPRLANGTPAERNNWKLVGEGLDIHWPDLDEDIEAQHLLLGLKSGEGPASLRKWLDEREAKKKRTRKKASA